MTARCADHLFHATAGRGGRFAVAIATILTTMRNIASRNQTAGFSLIELMVTLTIAAIVLGIAIPSFRDMAVRNQLASLNNNLISAINFARSEAVKRGVPVAICHSANKTACGGAWSDGWIVFVNPDGDEPAVVGAATDILKSYEGLPTNYSIGETAVFANDITYGRAGAATNTGIFAFCYNSQLTNARAVIVTPLRPRVATDTDGNRIPNRDDGSDIASCSAP